MDCSISVKFSVEFDHVTSAVPYYKRSRSDIKGQGHNVKRSSDRQLQEIGVAESNSDVRILTRSWEIAVCAHAQRSTKLAKTAQNNWRDVGRPQVAMPSQLPPFLVVLVLFIC